MKNVFTIESPRKHILVFGNCGGFTSGTLLKQIDFRQPKVIQKYKELAKDSQIGDILTIGTYKFLIVKKHYANVLKKSKLEELLQKNKEELNEVELKTTNDDHSAFKDLILEYIPTLEYRETGKWGVFDDRGIV